MKLSHCCSQTLSLCSLLSSFFITCVLQKYNFPIVLRIISVSHIDFFDIEFVYYRISSFSWLFIFEFRKS